MLLDTYTGWFFEAMSSGKAVCNVIAAVHATCWGTAPATASLGRRILSSAHCFAAAGFRKAFAVSGSGPQYGSARLGTFILAWCGAGSSQAFRQPTFAEVAAVNLVARVACGKSWKKIAYIRAPADLFVNEPTDENDENDIISINLTGAGSIMGGAYTTPGELVVFDPDTELRGAVPAKGGPNLSYGDNQVHVK